MKLGNQIKAIAGALSPNCREAVRAQSEALEHPLPPLRRFGLRMHLLLCQWCRRYGRQIRLLRDTAGQHPEHLLDAMPQQLSAEARARIKQRLQDRK